MIYILNLQIVFIFLSYQNNVKIMSRKKVDFRRPYGNGCSNEIIRISERFQSLGEFIPKDINLSSDEFYSNLLYLSERYSIDSPLFVEYKTLFAALQYIYIRFSVLNGNINMDKITPTLEFNEKDLTSPC